MHGLDPLDYDAATLERRARAFGRAPAPGPEAQAEFDVALSVAILRRISDVHIGRVNPRNLDFGYDLDSKKLDLAAVVAGAVQAGRIASAVEAAEPPLRQHRLLEEQLARYRARAEDASLTPVEFPPRLRVRPGDPLAQAPALARWLAAQGDLPAGARARAVYDDDLVAGVRRFQARHGLEVDGIVGPKTAAALAIPLAARVRQIELALERLRWMPELGAGRAVFVNVPGFELVAFDAIGPETEPALRMAVVVGKAARTPTPIFAGAMRTVVFAPYWNVPRSIALGEILPKEARKPGHIASQNMEIVGGSGTIADLRAGRARLRQRPGPRNSLGRVKFLFPNPHNVYLHDTPSRSLFQRSRRDFSHGCIRVAEPEALARWVLAPEGWDAARVAAGLARRSERGVPLSEPIPVVIYYTTALAHGDGTISFFEDIYGHDAALERALARGATDTALR